jgi:actin related protein 2/3 complex subunit 1A/1B
MIRKKLKSTVLCCAFHPTNGQILATGSSDFKCRVYSTYSSEVDAAPDAGVFGAPQEFGELYLELSCNGWVNAVAWTPSGSTLVYASHDSTIHFASFVAEGGSAPVVQSIRTPELPYCSLLAVSDKAVVAVGHDFNPSVYVRSSSLPSGAWESHGKLETKVSAAAGATATGGASEGVAAARALFQNKTSRGQEASDTKTLWTQHENTVTGLRASAGGSTGTTKVGADYSRALMLIVT